MNNVLKASCAAAAASVVFCGHFQHTHSIPFMYQRISPYVVTIDSIGSKRNPYDINGDRVPVQTGVGSGFIVKGNIVHAPPVGHRQVVTNYHVINDAEHVIVRFGKNGTQLEATIQGVDIVNDIAILDILGDDTGGLQLCEGLSDIGEDVLAIGSPYGLENSLSVGVVGGVNRELSNTTPDGLVQTDAIINPGNSGGPLISRNRGCVIGMNTATINQGSGLGFAVPASKIKSVVSDVN